MASSEGPSHTTIAVWQAGAVSLTAVPKPVHEITAPPTRWERLQCYVLGPKDDMDLIRAAQAGEFEDCDRILQRGMSNINTQDEKTEQTALHIAASRGNEAIVSLLLTHRAKLIQDSDGNTPLHLAIQNGHISCSQRILEHASANTIDLPNKAHITALHLAVKKGYIEIAEKLLKKSKANINAPDKKHNTALHIAVLQGDERFLDLLHRYGAECSMQDGHGNTPLHLAIEHDHCSCSKKILEWENININLVNKERETTLHVAVSKNYKEVVEKRLKKNITPNTNPDDKKKIKAEVAQDYKYIVEKLLEKSPVNIDAQKEKNKDTALHIAIRMKKDDIVDMLLSHKADCNAQNCKGRTALHVALMHNPACAPRILQCDNLQIHLISKENETPLYLAVKKSYMAIVKKLLEKNIANIDVQHTKTEQTALHVAAKNGKEELVEILLENKANSNIQNIDGDTPLHLAIQNGHNGCSDKILNSNTVNINLKNKNQESPLHLAVKNGHDTIVDKLLNRKLDNNLVDICGNTALHLLAEYGYHDCCAKLLQRDAVNLNAKTKTGDTPLHLAARAGKHGIIALLQQYPADCNSQNSSQDTPLHLAVHGGHLECVTELLKFNNLMIDSTNKDDSTALHCAVKKGNSDIVSVLLRHHADCSARDNLGNTLLHLAVDNGDLNCCEELLEHSDLKINTQNTSGEAALHMAARLGHHQVTKLLLCKGADWRVRDKYSKMPLHCAAEKGCEKSCEYLVNAFKESGKPYYFKLRNGRTPQMLAAMGGHHSCCEILLSLDNIDEQDHEGKTALMYAIEKDYERTAFFLLRNNAKTDIKVLSKVKKNNQTKEDCKEKKRKLTKKDHGTVLHLAAKNRASKCLKCLLEDPKTKELLSETDEEGHTPLHMAINSEALECAKILLSQGASPIATTNTGMTPLHLAAKSNPGLCGLLLSCEVDVHAENSNEETPLHVAAKHGNLNACRMIKKKGIKSVTRDKSGRTPLHLAAAKGSVPVVQCLLNKGPKYTDDEGSTALHLAAAEGHLEVCQVLVRKCPSLMMAENKEGKLSVDVAFENQKDDVFAFLISKLEPKGRNEENMERTTHFHKYMHQALRPQGQNMPRETAAEAILDSEWWRAAFIVEEEEKDYNSGTEDENECSDTQERSPYCTNLLDMINNHPKLALKVLDRYHDNLSPTSHYFWCTKPFDYTRCSEAGLKKCHGQQQALTARQKLLQDQLKSLSKKRDECPDLLLHPITDNWIRQVVGGCLVIMLIHFLIEYLYFGSIVNFMKSVNDWKQIEHECDTNNTTLEEFCHILSSLGEAEVALNHTKTTQDGLLLKLVDGNFSCFQQTSPEKLKLAQLDWWIVVIMTAIIVLVEVNYVCKRTMAHLHHITLLRWFQIILVLSSCLWPGPCGWGPNVINTWQWKCGIFTLLLEWIMLYVAMKKACSTMVFMPITGEFIMGCLLTIMKVMIPLFAFSSIFQLLLNDQDAFQDCFLSYIKMITWLFGEFNFDDTFVKSKPLHFDMALCMFVLFLLFKCGFIVSLALAFQSNRLEDFARNEKLNQKLYWIKNIQLAHTCFPWVSSKAIQINLIFRAYCSKKMKLANPKMLNMLNVDTQQKTRKPQDDPLADLEKQVAKLVDMSQVQGRKMQEMATLVNMCQKQGQEVQHMYQKQGQEVQDMYQKQGQEQQDMRRELSMEIKEFRQQLNVLFKHIAEKD